jgi:hypothetical protein
MQTMFSTDCYGQVHRMKIFLHRSNYVIICANKTKFNPFNSRKKREKFLRHFNKFDYDYQVNCTTIMQLSKVINGLAALIDYENERI